MPQFAIAGSNGNRPSVQYRRQGCRHGLATHRRPAATTWDRTFFPDATL